MLSRRKAAKVHRQRYGLTGAKKWVWKRPGGEKVTLHGFTAPQLDKLRPALTSSDTSLHPNVRINANIKMARTGQLERAYRHKGKIGGMTSSHLFKKQTIDLNPKNFERRGYFDPGGVLTHEIGHAISNQRIQDKRTSKDWAKSFGYSSNKRRDITKPDKWKSTIKRKKTRQNLNPYEDFAETYRAMQGLPMTQKERKYFKTAVDDSRTKHIKEFYYG